MDVYKYEVTNVDDGGLRFGVANIGPCVIKLDPAPKGKASVEFGNEPCVAFEETKNLVQLETVNQY